MPCQGCLSQIVATDCACVVSSPEASSQLVIFVITACLLWRGSRAWQSGKLPHMRGTGVSHADVHKASVQALIMVHSSNKVCCSRWVVHVAAHNQQR